ncbi:MAG: AraC family transcriptional regulator [Clostridia bacterium]|nr:AraC family transcriptional regulator [Clostridia bacterium]
MLAPIVTKAPDTTHFAFCFPPDDPIRVIQIGWHKTPPANTLGPVVREYWLLHLILKGCGTFRKGGKEWALGAGQAFLICPQETIVYQADEKDPWEYFWISFSGDFAEELVKRTTDQCVMTYRQSGLLALQTALKQEIRNPLSTLNVLFTVLQAINEEPQTKETDAIAAATQYLESNYPNEISIDALALSFGYSRAHFTTLFTQKTGDSPYRYLTKLRMRKAKEYLFSTNLSIEAIGYSVGFSCLGRFSEVFKRQEGVTPLAYRKAHGQDP